VKLRFACALAVALAAACSVVSPSLAVLPTAKSAAGYSYAGLIGTRGPHGIAASLTAVDAPVVRGGHVAAWVGVGGRYEGPGGQDEWLQVGLSSGRGSGNTLYYEWTRPGDAIHYVQVAQGLPVGQAVPVMVLQMSGRADTWRVWVNGAPVGDPIILPGSDAKLTPMATAENWDGGAGAVNSYSYRFDGVRVARTAGGVWRPFAGATPRADAGNTLQQFASSFVASTTPPPGTVASAGVAPADTVAENPVPGHRLGQDLP